MSLKMLVQKAIETGTTQRDLAVQIGVSQGTIGNVLADLPPKKIEVLEKFAAYFRVSVEELRGKSSAGHGHQHAAQPTPAYGTAQRLMELTKQLDPEELATLERCAQAFHVEDQDVRLHLIGQLKLIERIIKGTKPARVRASPPQKAAGGSGAAKDRMERAAG